MEEVNSSSLPLLNNISESYQHPDNQTEVYNGFTGTKKHSTVEIIYLTCLALIIVFGTIGHILTFIIMRKGSLKDVSTCFYMSILAVADLGE